MVIGLITLDLILSLFILLTFTIYNDIEMLLIHL